MNLNAQEILNIDKSQFDNLSESEQNIVLEILQEFADNGFSPLLEEMWNADYEEIPVDIVTFICDDKYLGKSTRQGTSIYPFWMEKYKEIFSDKKEYLEIVLTGAIGIGKTRTAVVCLCYLLYLIMCLKNPHEFFHFNEGDEITIAFCNITIELAEGVAFNTMHEYLLSSPWFLERGTVTGKKVLRYNPPKHITMSFGSKAGHFLGKQIYAALMDEVDFKSSPLKGVDILSAQSGILETYTQIKERINSRFIVNGKQYGRMFLVSSKKSEHDFLESYVRKLQSTEEAKNMLIVDEPQWVVKPKGTYSDKTFKVAVGNRLLQSYIIPSDVENDEILLKDITEQGYNIIEVPIDLRQSFILNINTALMNLAGISVIGTTSFFNYALFSKCYMQEYVKPFGMDILEIGLHDELEIKNFFHSELISESTKSLPHFLHIDTSLKGDITGLTDVAIVGKRKQINENAIDEVNKVKLERCYKHIFTVGIKAPRGDEISLEKTRQFIYYLKDIGFNIKRISIDGFQSADTRQILTINGFDAIIISMDKLKDGEQPGYITARSAMNDGRVGMIPYEKLENELVRLQKDNTTGKIDHPIDGCFTSDTKILLADNRSLSIAELIIEQNENKTNYVYTINENTNEIEIKPIKKVFKTKEVYELLYVKLSNGKIIRCTPEHKFMIADSTYIEANNLFYGQSLKSLHNSVKCLGIYKITYTEPISVYDLEITDNHNFALAAGIFVHNSKDLSDSFAGAIYNASTYEENPTFNIDWVDSFDEVNYDEDELIQEQAKLAMQLLSQGKINQNNSKNNNSQNTNSIKPIGLLDIPNNTINKNKDTTNIINRYSSDDFIVF